MRLAGKAAPEGYDLKKLEAEGFERMEVYLERDHLDAYDESLRKLKEVDADVVSVHTPHVNKDEREYLEKAVDLAAEFDALVVFHSSSIHVKTAFDIGEGMSYDRIAYENDYGYSRRAIENVILGTGHELVLDTAHLYIASDEFYEDLAALADRASHVHLCDSSATTDGLAFGEGEIDVERMVETLDGSSFDGEVVLEVMPAYQQDAKDVVESILGDEDG